MNNNNGFVMLNRNILEWEWYQDINAFKVFMHCLIKVNYTAKKWQGNLIDKGEFITSYNILAIETGLTVSKVRTALCKIEKSKYIRMITTTKFTKIRVINLNEFISEPIKSQFDMDKNIIGLPSSHQISESNEVLIAKQSQAMNKKLADQSQTIDKPLATTNTNNKNIKTRKKIFKERVYANTQFNLKILKNFYDYWSELDPAGIKMRCEGQHYFEIRKRLEKWENSERNFKMDKKDPPQLIKNR